MLLLWKIATVAVAGIVAVAAECAAESGIAGTAVDEPYLGRVELVAAAVIDTKEVAAVVAAVVVTVADVVVVARAVVGVFVVIARVLVVEMAVSLQFRLQ